ncbi:hypothetical protein DP091_25075 [Paenibacillus sp. MDMC362]|nr:hypothetical protein DP091_25075 [Paenibacillus sp. MDMC362]
MDSIERAVHFFMMAGQDNTVLGWLKLLVAFGWSILPSLYLAATPGIFAWFGAASLGYLFAYLFMKPYRPG